MRTGAELIATERQRQIDVEGYTADHDQQHGWGAFVRAGACYETRSPRTWPWGWETWKPKDDLSNLIRAGALYQAAADSTDSASLRGAALRGVNRVAGMIDDILAAVVRYRADQ